jgi:VanZ family protein
MLKHIRKLSKDSFRFLAVIITIIIAVLSLIKIGKEPISFSHLDKVEHLIAYFVLSLFWLLSFESRTSKIVVTVLIVLYGILLEVLQSELTTYRTFDYFDMIANSLGVLLAFLAVSLRKKSTANC